MPSTFSKSYIERLLAERDFGGIYHLISVLEREREIPEEFWLFCRIYEWAPSRSGVWQYYEGLSEETFERTSKALDRFNLDEIAKKYRYGKTVWTGPELAVHLDKWLEDNQKPIHDAIFALVVSKVDVLKQGN